MANEYTRKQYLGGAVQTTITGTIDDNDTSITIATTTGWPSGATPFVVTVDVNLATEESMLVTRSGSTLTVVERGYDGTTAQAHTSGGPIIHSFDAHSADQANRLANLQSGKGDLIVHNGTNPVSLDVNLAGDGTDDGKIIKTKNAEAGGWEISYPDVVNTASSAPAATSATKYGVWFDATLSLFRPLISAAWYQPNNVYAYASLAALNAGIAAPRAGQLAQIGDNIVVRWDDTLNRWRVVGLPLFANASARNTFFGDATVDLYDGAQAYTQDDHSAWLYRNNEWIRQSVKITTSASAPVDPQDGDVWFQPVD
jgi:hypothetical protein